MKKGLRFVLLITFAAAFLGAPASGALAQMSKEAEFLNAVKDGAYRKVKLMALGTINLDVRNRNGTPALVMAVENGDGVMTSMLLRAGADPDIVDRDSGETPLTLAAARNNGDLVERLLEGGADPNAENRKYETALIKAVRNDGRRSIISALLDAGANPHWQDFTGHSALWYAESNRRPDVIQMLKKAVASD